MHLESCGGALGEELELVGMAMRMWPLMRLGGEDGVTAVPTS